MTTTIQQDLFVLTGLQSWEQSTKRASTFFDGHTDEELYKEIVPGKNRIIYLLGHLTAVHDRMFPLLGLGERLYPQLDALFITSPDNTAAEYPSPKELREYWKTVNQRLTELLKGWTPEEWLQKHTAVSDEDFAREPHRNRFSVVINRAGHVQYHLGQLVWFKK
ncbi:MAG TPA: DinB family protein [Puia sp.]|jgi:hypothetical protein